MKSSLRIAKRLAARETAHYRERKLCALVQPRFWSVEAHLPLPAALLRGSASDNPFWSVERPLPAVWLGIEHGYYPLMLNGPTIAYKPIPKHRSAALG